MDTGLDDSFFLRLRTEIPQGCGCLAAGFLFLSVHTVIGERVSLKTAWDLNVRCVYFWSLCSSQSPLPIK